MDQRVADIHPPNRGDDAHLGMHQQVGQPAPGDLARSVRGADGEPAEIEHDDGVLGREESIGAGQSVVERLDHSGQRSGGALGKIGDLRVTIDVADYVHGTPLAAAGLVRASRQA